MKPDKNEIFSIFKWCRIFSINSTASASHICHPNSSTLIWLNQCLQLLVHVGGEQPRVMCFSPLAKVSFETPRCFLHVLAMVYMSNVDGLSKMRDLAVGFCSAFWTWVENKPPDFFRQLQTCFWTVSPHQLLLPPKLICATRIWDWNDLCTTIRSPTKRTTVRPTS